MRPCREFRVYREVAFHSQEGLATQPAAGGDMLPTLGSSVPVASGRCSPVAGELRRWVPRAPESLPGARVTTARSFDFV